MGFLCGLGLSFLNGVFYVDYCFSKGMFIMTHYQ